jgi:outer membrane protein OmpA-like peptidoglycan-associated protein
LDLERFNSLTTLMDSAKVMEADIFAPKAWKKTAESFRKAEQSINANKKQKDVNKNVDRAMEYVENAIKASEVGKLTLKEYLDPRDKAKKAGAPVHVPEIYMKAESQFIKATAKVESGNVKGALKEAEKSSGLFDIAEMEAVRVDILGKADRLIKKAEADDAAKYAVSTLDKARTARRKADAILVNDRYNRIEAKVEADRAEYEARHATNIALSVRSLNRNDQAWEKLMLLYEIQMDRVGQAIGLEYLPFDNGPLAAADTMISRVKALKATSTDLSDEGTRLSGQFENILAMLDISPEDTDPITLGMVAEEAVARMAGKLQSAEQNLSELEATNKETKAALAVRVDQETRFKTAKTMLNPSEGEVLFNSSNDVVLRLSGLSFDIGQSDIKEEHVTLLEKVEDVIELFPDAQLVVEGHTDATGDAAANMLLSEKRAFAVMQYIRQSLLVSADRIQSMGYGTDRPIASNQTSGGRSKNRRIDIIIMR